MSEEFVITIHDAIELWDCLATMRIGTSEISVNTEYRRDAQLSKYVFAVKGTQGKHVPVNYDEVCVVSFKDYSTDILLFTERQIKITAFIVLYKQLRNIENIVLREKAKWLLEQQQIEASLDITQGIDPDEDY